MTPIIGLLHTLGPADGNVKRVTTPKPTADFPRRYAATRRFSLGTPRTITITPDGSTVFFCRSTSGDDPVQYLYAWTAEHGEKLLFDPTSPHQTSSEQSGELDAAEQARRERARESASGVVSYSTNRAGSRVCLSLDGALWMIDVATATATMADFKRPVFDPRFNPAGDRIVFVSEGAVYRAVVEHSEFGPISLVRGDGHAEIIHGVAEFIAAEEMGRSRGFWWAPDGESLLVTRVDERQVVQCWIADPAHPETKPRPIRYPKAGSTNAAVELEWIAPDGTITKIDWSDSGSYEYLAEVVSYPNHPVLVLRQTRDQKTVSVAKLNPDTGQVDEVHRITNDVWVELFPAATRWHDSQLLTIEDNHHTRSLCLDGNPITPEGLHVHSIIGSGHSDEKILITAWTSPTEIQVLSVDPTAPDHPPIGLVDHSGVQSAQIGGDIVVISAATADQAGVSTTVHHLLPEPRGSKAPDGGASTGIVSLKATIQDRSEHPGFSADPIFTSFGSTRLNTAVFMPSHHDGETPLPVLLDPYGGPHAQRVLRNHNPHLVSRWFAEQGFAVLVTDGRGTPGRGPAWEREVWGDLAAPVLDDQISALDGALAKYPFLDPSRVGIRGWSFGGYLAALAVLRRPDRFGAAIAGAPVTSWKLYDTHYTERYLGHPDTYPHHYDQTDLISEVLQAESRQVLKVPMLLIHGLADDNVVAANTLQFSTALLANGSPHHVLPLSGVTHMTPQEAVAENLLRFQLDFLDHTIGAQLA